MHGQLISIIKPLLWKWHFKNLLAQMRGAKKLRESGDPFFVVKIVNNITDVTLGLRTNDFPKSLVGLHSSVAEILLKQIFLQEHNILCSSIMQSIGNNSAVSMPLPPLWVEQLIAQGVNCSPFLCRINLFLSAIKKFAKGLLKFITLLSQVRNPKISDTPYVVFLGLQKNNLPALGVEKSYDIISWYKFSKFRKSGIKKIVVQSALDSNYPISQDLIVSRSIFPVIGSFKNYLVFILNGLNALLVSILGLLRGKWWYGYLAPEAIDLQYIKALPKELLAKEYFFNNSNWFYKPLWTYEIECTGALVTLYYYSTNIEKIEYYDYKAIDAYGLSIMTWNRFIVWDEQQKEYLKRFCPKANYYLAGVIDFADTPVELGKLDAGLKIAIFDVTPARPVFYATHGMGLPPYYSESLCLKFFFDIASICSSKNVNLLWKQKRLVGTNFVANRFLKKRNNITTLSYKAIDPRVSARRLIEQCDAVISMPFTSTALIGKDFGLPSIYYDPFEQLQVEESHGIPVLKGAKQLRDWFEKI